MTFTARHLTLIHIKFCQVKRFNQVIPNLNVLVGIILIYLVNHLNEVNIFETVSSVNNDSPLKHCYDN